MVRPALRIHGQALTEIDVRSAQPLLLGFIAAKLLTGEWRTGRCEATRLGRLDLRTVLRPANGTMGDDASRRLGRVRRHLPAGFVLRSNRRHVGDPWRVAEQECDQETCLQAHSVRPRPERQTMLGSVPAAVAERCYGTRGNQAGRPRDIRTGLPANREPSHNRRRRRSVPT